MTFNYAYSSSIISFEKGVELYGLRSKQSVGLKANPVYIDSAISSFLSAKNIKSYELEASIYLLKCFYFKGKYVFDNQEEKKNIFNKGKELGESLIRSYPKSPGAYYWYLVNLGSWSEEYGIIAAAREGAADIMFKYSNKIIELDKNYADGGGYFLLGAAHFKAPYIPFILSWPNNKEAIKYLKKATETGDETASQTVYLAQAFFKNKNKERAISLLKTLLEKKKSPDRLIDDLEQHQKAKNLLVKWD
jgi:TPR repeat protein